MSPTSIAGSPPGRCSSASGFGGATEALVSKRSDFQVLPVLLLQGSLNYCLLQLS